MIINHNLYNKILQIKSKLEWLDRMKLIDKEYYQNYIYHNYAAYYEGIKYYKYALVYWSYQYHQRNILQIENDARGYISEVNAQLIFFNNLEVRRKKGISYINYFKNLNNHIDDYIYNLPEKYFYSSGLNNQNGYK